MSAPPCVSVVTPFLNAQTFIDEAIDSVFAQTDSRWELLLVDDGSTDGSSLIARHHAALAPQRVHYLEHPLHENRGISASRNLALTRARGRYVAFIDADDVYLPEKLERQVRLMDTKPEVGMVYAATEYWHQWSGSPSATPDWTWTHFGVPSGLVLECPGPLPHLLRDGGTAPCMGSVMIRRDVLAAIGGFEEQFRGLFEDQAFLAKASLAAPVYVMAECLDRYRQHPGSMCSRASALEVDAARQTYLRWLASYMRASTNATAEVWSALDEARRGPASDAEPSLKRSVLALGRMLRQAKSLLRGSRDKR